MEYSLEEPLNSGSGHESASMDTIPERKRGKIAAYTPYTNAGMKEYEWRVSGHNYEFRKRGTDEKAPGKSFLVSTLPSLNQVMRYEAGDVAAFDSILVNVEKRKPKTKCIGCKIKYITGSHSLYCTECKVEERNRQREEIRKAKGAERKRLQAIESAKAEAIKNALSEQDVEFKREIHQMEVKMKNLMNTLASTTKQLAKQQEESGQILNGKVVAEDQLQKMKEKLEKERISIKNVQANANAELVGIISKSVAYGIKNLQLKKTIMVSSVDIKSALRQDVLHAINASACKWKVGEGLAHERTNMVRSWPASFFNAITEILPGGNYSTMRLSKMLDLPEATIDLFKTALITSDVSQGRLLELSECSRTTFNKIYDLSQYEGAPKQAYPHKWTEMDLLQFYKHVHATAQVVGNPLIDSNLGTAFIQRSIKVLGIGIRYSASSKVKNCIYTNEKTKRAFYKRSFRSESFQMSMYTHVEVMVWNPLGMLTLKDTGGYDQS